MACLRSLLVRCGVRKLSLVVECFVRQPGGERRGGADVWVDVDCECEKVRVND